MLQMSFQGISDPQATGRAGNPMPAEGVNAAPNQATKEEEELHCDTPLQGATDSVI